MVWYLFIVPLCPIIFIFLMEIKTLIVFFIYCKNCNFMLVIRNNGSELKCARCKVNIKRSDITDEELYTNSRRLIHSFITDIDNKSVSEAELESIERNLEINSEKIVKSHNLERELKIKQDKLFSDIYIRENK